MTCYRCSALLSAYIDAELTFRQSAGVREHLRVCARCRAEHDDFERIDATAREDPIPPVPPELRERVRRAPAEEAEDWWCRGPGGTGEMREWGRRGRRAPTPLQFCGG